MDDSFPGRLTVGVLVQDGLDEFQHLRSPLFKGSVLLSFADISRLNLFVCKFKCRQYAVLYAFSEEVIHID
jgi:hypothetical protein